MHGIKTVPTNADDIELETSFQELALNLLCDTVEPDMAARKHGVCHFRCHDMGSTFTLSLKPLEW